MAINVPLSTHVKNGRAGDLQGRLQTEDLDRGRLDSLLRQSFRQDSTDVAAVILQEYADNGLDTSSAWFYSLKQTHATGEERWAQTARSTLPDPETVTPELFAHFLVQSGPERAESVLRSAAVELPEPDGRPVDYPLYNAAYYALRSVEHGHWEPGQAVREVQQIRDDDYAIQAWLEAAEKINDPDRQFALDTLGVVDSESTARACFEQLPEDEKRANNLNDVFEQAARHGNGQTLRVMFEHIDQGHEFSADFETAFFAVDAPDESPAPKALPSLEIVRRFMQYDDFATGGLTPEQAESFYNEGDAEALRFALDRADRPPRPEVTPSVLTIDKLRVILNNNLALYPNLVKHELVADLVSRRNEPVAEALSTIMAELPDEHLEQIALSEGRHGPGPLLRQRPEWLEKPLDTVLPETAASCEPGLRVADLLLVEALDQANIDVIEAVYEQAERTLGDVPEGILNDLTDSITASDALRLYQLADDSDTDVLRDRLNGEPIRTSTVNTIGSNYDRAYKLLKAGAAVPSDHDFFKALLKSDRERAEAYLSEAARLPAETFYWALNQEHAIFKVVAKYYKPDRAVAVRAANKVMTDPTYELSHLKRLQTMKQYSDFEMDWTFEPSRGSDELSHTPLALAAGYRHRPDEQTTSPRRSYSALDPAEAIERLVDLGADPNDDPTAMREALSYGRMEEVEALIKNGFRPEQHPAVGAAALREGAKDGPNKLNRLLRDGLEPAQAPEAYLEAIQPRPGANWQELAEILNETGEVSEVIETMPYPESLKIIKELAKRGIDFNQPEGRRSLNQWLVVADYNDGEGGFVKELLSAQQKRGEFGPPPIELVSKLNRTDLIEALEAHMTKRQASQLNVQLET